MTRRGVPKKTHWHTRGLGAACKAKSRKLTADPLSVTCANCISYLEGNMVLHPSGELCPGWDWQLARMATFPRADQQPVKSRAKR